ncbi:MAG: cytochrome c oxidase subunit II [Zetaproteobacteria bacterium]|nr:cytochrome c oxidase subunit II [Zetaproteobacteria bacterium]
MEILKKSTWRDPLQRLGLGWMAFSTSVFAEGSKQAKAFDEVEYQLRATLESPMNTIAGLTEWARGINHVYGITTLVVTLVFLAVSIPLIMAIVKFRVPEGTDLKQLKPPKQVHGNVQLEFVWAVIPVILLLFIAVPTWEAIFEQPEEAPEDALVVKVIGHQWWWEFQYPKYGITTANELHLPAETPVFFELTSADVIHSFWIPKMGGKKDCLPGKDAMNSMFFVTPAASEIKTLGGEYFQGQCAELCGSSHALMRFDTVLHTREEFGRWTQVHNQPPQVTSALQEKGQELFAQCAVCHTLAGTPSEEQEKSMLALGTPKQGPNLSNLGSRKMLGAGTRWNNQRNFIEWVKNPQSIKPGATMTAFGHLSEEELLALSAYLMQSTVKKI